MAAPAPPAVERPGGSVAAAADVAGGLVDEADAALVPAGSAKGTTAVVAAAVELAGAAEPAVAVVDGRTTVVISMVTTDEFPPEHPLTNKSTAPAAAKIRRRRTRPEGRHRDEQLIDDI